MDLVNNRYDFVLFFDVKDGNPNGDPDAGNLPRLDPETGNGLVTDVCIKRKVRNYVQLDKAGAAGYDIYVKEKAVLGRAHVKAFQELNIKLGTDTKNHIDKEVYGWLDENGLPEGITIDADEENDSYSMIVAADADKKEINVWLKDTKPPKNVQSVFSSALKNAKSRRPNAEEVEKGRDKMCKDYFDIRTFGGVLSLKSAPNCGQVRGPVQFTFARSIDQIVPLEHSITRMAVATEAESEKQHGDNRTMGRKFTVPYALYRCYGFVSAPFAAQTGFSTADLDLFWQALLNMFEHDRSAARGFMATRKLIIFKHDSALGNTPAHVLFNKITCMAKVDCNPVRDFGDYTITVPSQVDMPNGVTLEIKL